MNNLKKQYRDLEMRVHAELREAINNSDVISTHMNQPVILVNVFDYTELAIIHDRLTFLDARGMQYSLWGDCSLEDLIDILTEIKNQ